MKTVLNKDVCKHCKSVQPVFRGLNKYGNRRYSSPGSWVENGKKEYTAYDGPLWESGSVSCPDRINVCDINIIPEHCHYKLEHWVLGG